MEKERRVILEEINMTLDNPRQQVEMLFDELMWPAQPLGRDVAGRKETVESITGRQIEDYYKKHYSPNNAVLAIAGDFKQDSIIDNVNSILSDWQMMPAAPRFAVISGQTEARVHIETRDIEQAQISLGVQGVSIFDNDRFAVDLLSTILGEGMSSRLFVELREKLGLAYEIGSSIDHFIDSGSLIIHAGIDPTCLEEALCKIIDQLMKIKEDVTEEELARAGEMAKGRLLMALENSRKL
jgi:predicted Zn-dependent peptidase